MLYSVRIPSTGRCVKWCDSHWYETVPYDNPVFTKERAQEICSQMRSHYTYRMQIVGDDGHVEEDINHIVDVPEKNMVEMMYGFLLKPTGTDSGFDILF